MKNIIYILFLFSITAIAQDRYLTKTGSLNFEASVPSFEEVAAKNNSVTVIVNPNTGDIAALVLINGFRFKNALMEEHFNENYAESHKYPKATFKGHIEAFSLETLDKNFKFNGELTFHGVTKPINDVLIKISNDDGALVLSGHFIVNASDFKIEIPKIVKNKVSEKVEIDFNFRLTKK
jgi:polyisoprenoid-binding protein YceI